MSTRNIAALAAFAALLPAVGQAAALPGFALAADTRRVAVYTRGAKVDVEGIESSLSRIETALGQPLRRKAAYYRYETPQEIAAGTGYYANGVTFAGEVHSTEARHEHELVHLVAAELGQPGRFFQEGLAVAMTGERTLGRRDVKRLATGSRLSSWVSGFDSQDPAAAYAVAGSFVAWLIRSHGLPQVADYFRACRPGADHLAAFAATFGVALDVAGAAWTETL